MSLKLMTLAFTLQHQQYFVAEMHLLIAACIAFVSAKK